jgi:hypothetical protein
VNTEKLKALAKDLRKQPPPRPHEKFGGHVIARRLLSRLDIARPGGELLRRCMFNQGGRIMNTLRIWGMLAVATLALGGAAFADKQPTAQSAVPASSESETVRPFQLALVAPAQLVPADETIHGLRLNLIYGSNNNVVGVDIGVAHETKGDFSGVGFGLVSFVHGEGRGLQFNGIYTDAAKGMTGLQMGIFNHSASMHGLQIGLVNIADDMTGIQIGLWNEIKNKEALTVLPLFNACF